MSVWDRFGSCLASAEIELACSLPVCSKTQEVIFLYSTLDRDEESYIVEEIRHVYARDLTTGQLSEVSPEEIIPQAVLRQAGKSVVVPTVFDDEALDREEEYFACYEKFIGSPFEMSPDSEQRQNNRGLYQLFHKLVPASGLRDIYYAIGKDYFAYLKTM